MQFEAVIFDLDGTLTSFNLDYKALRAEVKSHLNKRGVPNSVLTLKETIFEMLQKAEVFFKNATKTNEVFIEVQQEALAIAERFELEAASSTNLMSGANDALKALKQMNVKIGLCTINSQKATNKILQRFKIASFFDAVIPREMVRFVKPNSEHYEKALEMLKINPEATLIVGDSSSDMQSAKEAKTIAVGVPTGVSTVQQLIQNGADYIITSIADLPVLIEKLNKEKSSEAKQ